MEGYGSYEELTSSGMDPTELFDDIGKGNTKPPNILKGECDDIADIEPEFSKGEESVHLLPVEKARRRVRLGHSESDTVNVDLKLEEASLYTTPSLYSLISVHDDINNIRGIKTEVCGIVYIMLLVLNLS